MYPIDKRSHIVSVARGEERSKTAPRILSQKFFYCPKCDRKEYGNTSQGSVVMCSLCLINEAVKIEKQATQPSSMPAVKVSDRPSGSRLRVKLSKNCHRCGDVFRPTSNRQKFCPRCQKGATNERWSKWIQKKSETNV